jgi:hypothetical protein
MLHGPIFQQNSTDSTKIFNTKEIISIMAGVTNSLSCRKLLQLSSKIILWLLPLLVKTGKISKEIQIYTI